MGLRSRRSSTATLRTINTTGGGNGGPQSPRESIAEEEEEPELAIAVGSKEEEIRRTRLNPKASSSWLRWNSPTPSFPKGKGKEKMEDSTPDRRASTTGDGVEAASERGAEGGLEGTIKARPSVLEDEGSSGVDTVKFAGPSTVPPPTEAKGKGWFTKNPPPALSASNTPNDPVLTTKDRTSTDKQSSEAVVPAQTTGSSDIVTKNEPEMVEPSMTVPSPPQSTQTDPGPMSDGAKQEDLQQVSSTEAGGWKEYLTWGRKGTSRPPIPPGPDPSEAVPKQPEPLLAEVQPVQQTTGPVEPPTAPEEQTQVDPPLPAAESDYLDTSDQPRQTWGSFLYGIVIPQTGPASQSTPSAIQPGVSESVVPTSATTEQPPVHIETIEGKDGSEEPAEPPAPAPTIEEPKSNLLATSTVPRKSSQASTTAGWLNYLAFRASQKKVENPASSVVTGETGQEVMDLSNDPNFPTGASDPKPSNPSAEIRTDTKTSMKPPAGIPDKRKRLSTSSTKSAASVVPIPPSPQSQARGGTAVSTPAPSQKISALPPPPQVPATQPNLVIPSFATTFDRPPRSFLPPKPPPTSPGPTHNPGLAWRALGAVGSYVYPGQEKVEVKVEGDPKETRGRKEGRDIGTDLPRRIGLAGEDLDDGWRNVKRIVVVGVHGW